MMAQMGTAINREVQSIHLLIIMKYVINEVLIEQTRGDEPMLVERWPTVYSAGSSINQCSLGQRRVLGPYLNQSINQSKVLFDIKLYIRIIGVVHVCCNVSGDPR